jgi:hypothetical protein
VTAIGFAGRAPLGSETVPTAAQTLTPISTSQKAQHKPGFLKTLGLYRIELRNHRSFFEEDLTALDRPLEL